MPDPKQRIVVVSGDQKPEVLTPKITAQQQKQQTETLIKQLQAKVESGKATNEEIKLHNYNVNLANQYQKKLFEVNAQADAVYSKKAASLFNADLSRLNNKENLAELYSSLANSKDYQTRYSVETPAYPGAYGPAGGKKPLTGPELMLRDFEAYKNNFTKTRTSELSKLNDYVKKKDYKSLYRIAESLAPAEGDTFFTDYAKEQIGTKSKNYVKALARAFYVDTLVTPLAEKPETKESRISSVLNNPESLLKIGRDLYSQEVGSELYGKYKMDIHLENSKNNPDNIIDYNATKLAAQSFQTLADLDYRQKVAEYSRLKLYAEKTKNTNGVKEAEDAFLASEKALQELQKFDVNKVLKDKFKDTYFTEKDHEEQAVRRAMASGPFEMAIKSGYAALAGGKATINNLIDSFYGTRALFSDEKGKAELSYLADINRFDKTGYTIGIDEQGNPVESSKFRWVDSKGKVHYNGYAIIESGIPVAEQMLETILLSKGIGGLTKGLLGATSGLARTIVGGDRLANLGQSILKTPLVGSTIGSAANLTKATLSNPEVYNRINTFASVYATTYPRIFMEEYDNFKNPEDAQNVARLRAMVESISESYVPNTPDLITKGVGRSIRNTYIQDLSAGLDGVVLDMLPGASNKFIKAIRESAIGRRALGIAGDVFQEGVIEEEASLLGNYFVDKYAKSKNQDYVEQNDLSFKNILDTAVESTAAMLLTAGFMGGGSKRAKKAQDNEAIISARWNIANNPDLYKSLIASRVEAKEITEEEGAKAIAKVDQYVKALETLPTKIGSIRDMKSLLEDKDTQYQFFSTHLKKQALLDYTPTEEELPAYREELKKLDTELYKTQELANKYDNLSLTDKRKIITDNFANKLNRLTQQDDFSPAALAGELTQAEKDLRENKNRVFSTELAQYVENLKASMELAKEKFKNFSLNNNEGLTFEQYQYKSWKAHVNEAFFTEEENEAIGSAIIAGLGESVRPLFSIQNEDEFLEALAKNYVTAHTNKKPLTSNGELLYGQIADQYVDDSLFARFTEGLPEEEAQKKNDELKNRFWTRVVELKQNLKPGQAFPGVETTPPVTTAGATGTTGTTQAATTATPATPEYADYVERFKKTANEGADVAAVREEVIEKLSEEATAESLMEALPGLQSIFLGTNLNDIVSDLQQGNTASLAEFLDEMGASPKQIETLVNKFAQEKTAGTTETTKTTETSTEAATDIEAKKAELKKQIEALPDDMIYATHVTEDDVAKNIYDTQFKFSLGTALQGTIGLTNKKGLLDLMNNLLDGKSPHRNQFGVFILAFPKSEFGETSATKTVNLDAIESQMLDTYPEFLEGKIPTKFNYGYFKDGKLFTKNAELAALEKTPTASVLQSEIEATVKALEEKFQNNDNAYFEIAESVMKEINRNVSSRDVAEAYYKAKANGSNPKLVKGIEKLLGKKDTELAALEGAPTATTEKVEEGEVFVTGTVDGLETLNGTLPKGFKDRRGTSEYQGTEDVYFTEEVVDGKKVFTLVDKTVYDNFNRRGFIATSLAVPENSPTTLKDVKERLKSLHEKTLKAVDKTTRTINKSVLAAIDFKTPEVSKTIEEPSEVVEPVTPEEAKEAEVIEESLAAQDKNLQEAEANQVIENIRENYVYLGIKDTNYKDETLLGDENVAFVFSFIDRIESSVSSADMRSLGYNYLMHSGREVLNRLGLDIQPKESFEEFKEQFRVNGILVLPQEEIFKAFKGPAYLDTVKLGMVTNEKGEPLFFDKTGEKVNEGTPIVTAIGQTFEREQGKGGKTFDEQFVSTIPDGGQIAPLSKFVNGKVVLKLPITAAESNKLMMHIGKEEIVTVGNKTYTLHPGVIYLETGNPKVPYRATYGAINTRESAEDIYTLIEEYNKARLNPEESTLSDYFSTMSPKEFISYLYNYAFIPKGSSRSKWGITPVTIKGERNVSIVRIYNNNNKKASVSREEAINLIATTKAAPTKEYFNGDFRFRPFRIQNGKVETGKVMNYKTWFGNFRLSNARIDTVPNRNIAFAKQDVRPLNQPTAVVITPADIVVSNITEPAPLSLVGKIAEANQAFKEASLVDLDSAGGYRETLEDLRERERYDRLWEDRGFLGRGTVSREQAPATTNVSDKKAEIEKRKQEKLKKLYEESVKKEDRETLDKIFNTGKIGDRISIGVYTFTKTAENEWSSSDDAGEFSYSTEEMGNIYFDIEYGKNKQSVALSFFAGLMFDKVEFPQKEIEDYPLVKEILKIEEDAKKELAALEEAPLSTPVANIPQNKVSGIESFGSTVTANAEAIKALGTNPYSIDMIEAGFRTRTTRSETEMGKYGIKVGDVIKHFGKSADGTTKTIFARVTAIHPKGTPGWKGTWNKEGWRAEDVDVIDRFKDGAAAIEFEVIKPTEVTILEKQIEESKKEKAKLEEELRELEEAKKLTTVDQLIEDEVTEEEVKQIAEEQGIGEEEVKAKVKQEVLAQMNDKSNPEPITFLQKVANRVKKMLLTLMIVTTFLTNTSFRFAPNQKTLTYDNATIENLKDFDNIKLSQDELNKKENIDIITASNKGSKEKYLIVDKTNQLAHLFEGDSLITTFEVGTGKQKGDEQTRTVVKNGKVYWELGNKQTGAGIYTVSGKGQYKTSPSFTLKNERGIEIPTALHETLSERKKLFRDNDVENNRMSNGCINFQAHSLKDLGKYADFSTGSKVYVLPDNPNNKFQIVDGQLAFVSNQKNVNKTTLRYQAQPITLKTDRKLNEAAKVFVQTLADSKADLMALYPTISNDIYNRIAKIAYGEIGQESSFGTYGKFSGQLGRLTDAAQIFVDESGIDNMNPSVGLSQIRLSSVRKEVRDKFNINTVSDLSTNEKNAQAMMSLLLDIYVNEIPNANKENLETILPAIYSNQRGLAQKAIAGEDISTNTYVNSVNKKAEELNLYVGVNDVTPSKESKTPKGDLAKTVTILGFLSTLKRKRENNEITDEEFKSAIDSKIEELKTKINSLDERILKDEQELNRIKSSAQPSNLLSERTPQTLNKLPNDIREEYKGKFIYVTPGAGKTTLAQGMQGVVDTDVLIVEEMKKRHPEFFAESKESIQDFIFRYVKTHDHKGEINNIVLEQAKSLANQGNTVLTGTIAFIKDADIVLTMPVSNPRIQERFKDTQTANAFVSKEAAEIKKSNRTAEPLTNNLEFFLTNKGFVESIDTPDNLPTIRARRGQGPVSLERSKLYAQQITQAQEEAAKLWVETVGKKAFGENRYLVEQFLTDPSAWARWSKAAGMVLFADASFADLYHESWHEFSQLYFTPEQREALYKTAAKIYGKLSTQELEEKLAEDFRQFMLTGVMPESIQKYKDARTTFQKIADFLRNLFSNKKTVDRYFENLAKGRVGKKVGKAEFGTLNSAKTLSLYNEDDELVPLSYQESKRYLDMIDEMFVQVGNQVALQAKAEEIKANPEAAKGISYINLMYTPANIQSVYNQIFNRFVDLEDEAIAKKDLVAQQELNKIFGIEDRNIDQIFRYHMINSSMFTEDMVSELQEMEEEELTDTNIIKDELGSKSQLELTPPLVLNVIRSIPKVDSQGEVITNALTGAPEFGDFTENWNILKNTLSGATTYAEMLSRIEKLTEEYPQFEYLLQALPVKITLDSAQQLRNLFFNIMSLEKVEGVTASFSKEGKFNVSNTGTLDIKRVRDAWALQFSTDKTGKFKMPSTVTSNFVLNPAIFTEYPEAPRSPEDVLAFLQEIGFNYSVKAQQAFIKDFGKLLPKFQYVYEKLKDVTLSGGFEISDPMLAIRQEHVNQTTGKTIKGKSYDLDRLVELESLNNLSFANDMVQVADGTSKFITTQATYQTKVIAALNNPKYKYFEDLFEEYPELDPSKNWGLVNSAYLEYLFDFTEGIFVDGKLRHKRNLIDGKPVSLKIVSLNGVTAEEDYGFNAKTIDLADPEKHLGDIRTLLSPYGRVEENNRIGEKSTTRGLMLSSENFFLYNKQFYYEGNDFFIKPDVWNIIYKYLEAEAKITDKESIFGNFNKNRFFQGVPQLAYFSEILSPELRTEVYEYFKNNTVEDFESSALKNLVKKEIGAWIAEAANASQNLLNKFEEYKVEGKNNDYQVDFNELQRYHTLSMIHRIEQYKLFNYHPYYYKNAKDVEKRIPAFNANGTFPVIDQDNLDYTQSTLTTQAAFEKFAEQKGMEVLPRKGTQEDITYLVIEDTALDSQTARENKKDYGIHYNSYAETKKKVDVQDAASLITLDFFRKFYALSKGLTNDMKKELDRQSTIWANLLEVKLNPKNTEAREALLKALNTPAHYIFSVKKLQYAGPGKTETEVVPVFHKYSNKVILPSEMVDSEELFNIAVKLHASNADYLVFSTGTKIAETVKPVPLFYRGKVDNSAKEAGVISLRYLKEQQEMEHKKDFVTIFATQFRKLLFKDLSTQEEKDLFKVYKKYIKQLTNHDMDSFLAKVKDKEAAVEFLIKELDKKNVSAITKDLIRVKEESGELEYAIDSLIERTMAEAAVTSALKKSFIRQKFNGTQFVQFPVSLVRPNKKLKFYRIEEGKIASAEAMISFSKKYYSLLDLPFDKNSTIGQVRREGNTQVVVNPYSALKRLNQKLADPAFRRKYQDSLTLAGVRIPVQGYNSMEKMEIVEFLPEESGNMILVPDELVVKSGGDFDIDKLFMYEPVLRNGRILTYENSYIKELEDLLKLPEKQTQEEMDRGMATTKLTMEEYMAKTGFTLGTAQEIKQINGRKEFLENSVEAEKRNLFQNGLLNTIVRRLSQKEIFMDLIEPNNVKDLDEFAKTAPEYLLGDTNKIIKDSSGRDMWSNLINPHYQLYVYQLAQVMEMVGVAAKANTFQAAVQDAELEIVDKDAIDLIYFDVNMDEDGNIKLWEIYDVDKNNKISQIISQFISGFVDVVKNDNILKNNINPNTTGVALYLNMMGVRYKDINTFLKDEAIYLFSKGQSFRDIILETSPTFLDDYTVLNANGTFSEYKTAVNILQSIDRETLLTDDTYKGSLARLAQFIILKSQQSKYVTPLIIGTDFDTQSIRNFESITRKDEDINEIYKSDFFNREALDKLIYDSTVSSFRVDPSFLDSFTDLFPISANRGLIEFLSVAHKKLGKTWIDYDNFSRKFKNALVTSILETNMEEFQEYATYLRVDPTIKNAQDLLTEIRKEAAENGAYIPLLDSVYFVGNINSDYIAPAVFRNDNNLDVDVKKEQFRQNLEWDSNKEQDVTEQFRNKVRNFFRIFAYTGIISSQLNKSHGSFLEIIPETIYTPVIDRYIKETAPDIEEGRNSEYLKRFYERFRYNNPDIFIDRYTDKVPNPSLKFYRNYDLDVPSAIVGEEYPNRVEKVKPTPAPAPILNENSQIAQTIEKTNKDIVDDVPQGETKTIKVISNQDLEYFANYLKKSQGKYPQEFFTSATRFKEFYNPQTARRENAPQSSKWIRQENGLYDLVDKETGEVYITGVNLETGLKTIFVPKIQEDVFSGVEEGEGFTSLEQELDVLKDELRTYEQAQREVKEYSTPLIIAENLPKITPESAEKETGGKIGKFGKQEDINASLISNKGTTVKRAAEDLSETLLNGENNYQKVEYSEVFDYIVEILLTGKAAFIEKHLPFVQEKQQVLERIAEIKQQIKEQAAQERLKEAQKPKPFSAQLDLFSSTEIEKRIEDNNRTIDPTTSDNTSVDDDIVDDINNQEDSECDL